MASTLNGILREITRQYLEEDLDMDNIPTPNEIENELFERIRHTITLENSVRDKNEKLKIPSSLSFSQISDIMAKIYPIIRIAFTNESAESDMDTLAIYQETGENTGIYVTSEDEFRKIATQYNYTLSSREFDEIMIVLRNNVTRKTRNNNKNLIAVNNGIFDYTKKILMPFSPDHVFMCKSHVNYNMAASNQIIHNEEDNTDWDIESWMAELTDNAQITQLLWELLGAVIRPNQEWYKSAWLYSESGNNGKGTLCELMRNLCGRGAYASIPIADFAKDFALEPLIRASAIIVDENDVGAYLDKVANLKAVITNDTVQINRKFKIPVAYKFYGFCVQCVNELPRIRDKSDSLCRRMLIIPFNKSFTGQEKKYIKLDYLNRKDVLEYVLFKVLNMNYEKLSEPDVCISALDEYKTFNNPVKEFLEEILDKFSWDFIPFTFLYALYQEWYKKSAPTGSIQGRNTFINDVIQLMFKNQEWYYVGKSNQLRVGNRMDKPEPLILQYNLKDWMNPTYQGSDPNVICKYPTDPNARYRGIVRYGNNSYTQNDEPEKEVPFAII